MGHSRQEVGDVAPHSVQRRFVAARARTTRRRAKAIVTILRRPRGPLLHASYACGSARSHSTATAFALAVWQYQRLQWKEGLIADLSTKLKKPAMHLPPVVNVEAIPEFAYRRVVVRGRFDHTREMLLGPKLQQGRLCYSLVTPLIRETAADESPGPDILVNRGYVDRDLAEQSRRPSSVADDSVTVVGMLRSQQSKSALASDNRPAAGQWIWPDIAAMAESAHTQPVLIDEVFGACRSNH